MKYVESAGWIGFSLGFLVGAIMVIILVSDPTPDCFEDEVIVWTDEAHDTCVPVDELPR